LRTIILALSVLGESVTSGAKADRVGLQNLLSTLQPDDLLAVTRLDRLARSTRDLLNILASVSERGAHFRSLHDR
jgi:DNA invertase Pin-like site-specific DNA recombinase